jgi:hypothetical protein
MKLKMKVLEKNNKKYTQNVFFLINFMELSFNNHKKRNIFIKYIDLNNKNLK